MKNLTPIFLCLWVIQASGQAFVTTWKTDNPGISASNQITIPTTGTGYNYNIYWEQVDNATINGTIDGITGTYTITFPSTGVYRIFITGSFPRIYFNGFDQEVPSDLDKILTVEQWGSIVWTSMANAFYGCKFLTIPATDAPNLSRVTDMSAMLSETPAFNQPVGHWDVSNVKNMNYLFAGALAFNQPLNSWNVSNVTAMHSVFLVARSFNQPLDNWDVSNVQDMTSMFHLATSFDQPLESWDVKNVKSLKEMFHLSPSFKQPLEAWDVSGATDMSHMFSGATSFNQSLSSWDVSNVTNMKGMLSGSGLDIINYDQTLIGWETQNVKLNVPLGADGLKYCLGEAARARLTNNKGWTITGDTNAGGPLPTVSLAQPVCYGSTGTITIDIRNIDDVYSFDNGITYQANNFKSGLAAGTYVVKIKNISECNTAANPVVINPPFDQLKLPIISGSPIVCPNVTGVDYSGSVEDYAYTWIIDGGVLQSQLNNKIKIDWGATNFSASVKAVGKDQHNCPTDTVFFPVKIQMKLRPDKPQGIDSVCYNFRTAVPYQTSYTNSSVYTWFTDGGIVSEGQTTSLAKIDWTDVGRHKLWVKEENKTATDYCEGTSDTLSVTVFKDLAAITTNFVSVDYDDDSKVQIQWDISLLERVSDLIIISRRISGSNASWEVVATLQKNVQAFLDQNVLTSEFVYEYKIEGFNKCDEGMQTVVHNTIKLDGEKDDSKNTIDLTWNDYNGWDGVERYEVWRKLDGDENYKLIDVTPGDITEYIGKHGLDGFVHVLRIKAKKKNENTISWSNELELSFDHLVDFIPNVITPNGDPTNEYFVIPRLDLYPENYLRIYNRWGNLIYESRNYKNDWNANELTDGVYYYTLYLPKNNSQYNGWIQVVR